VATELAAALNVSTGMALHQTHRGVALRDRLPNVAALFAAGVISDLLVRTIVSRTYLIDDAVAMAAVDAALADRVTGWGALSVKKTESSIDALVEEHDPGALRRATAATTETVQFGSPTDVPGTTTIWARLNAADAALIEQSVEDLARGVCDADPRSTGERRTAALTAAVTHTAFGCMCGDPDCSGASSTAGPPRTPSSTSWPTRRPPTPRPPPSSPNLPKPRLTLSPLLNRGAAARSRRTCWAPE
jgi:hypothetical protein